MGEHCAYGWSRRTIKLAAAKKRKSPAVGATPENDVQRDPALERAIKLMLSVAARPISASLQELTDEGGLSKGTTHRLLSRLERIGVVDRDPLSRRYVVGHRLQEAMQHAWTDLDSRRIAWPHMDALRAACGETVSLHQLDGSGHVAIEACEGTSELRRVVLIGRRLPLTIGATSKVLLAFMPAAQVKAAMRGATKEQEIGRSTKDLAAIRRQRYAVAVGELTPGLTAISTPIFDHRGNIWGGLAVAGPSFRFDSARIREIAPQLIQAATRVSQGLGYVKKSPRDQS